MLRLRDLKGLGPASEKQLSEAGIRTPEDLKTIGAVKAFIQLQHSSSKVSLNFLYALVGALENKHWATIAKTEKERLLMELEGHQELEALMNGE